MCNTAGAAGLMPQYYCSTAGTANFTFVYKIPYTSNQFEICLYTYFAFVTSDLEENGLVLACMYLVGFCAP